MGDPAIRVAGISKHYRLGADASIRRRLRHDTLSETLCRPFRRSRDKSKDADTTDFWALREVSFAIEPGEVVGIVGRNGSGKSTLLKILSRITEPTSGYAEVSGRVGSLLEVGTGFHPQLTGRENIFLNGAILGMTQAEVKRKFDEIVEFSEVARFLDTPVKNYSSGMYTRLAFAVAAHLDTEILIVDEVLAVGDAEFQKKCLGKMQSVAWQDGRTVLFVSHNMAAVSQLTKRCVLLDKGRVAHIGPTASAVEAYFGGHGHHTPTIFDVENVPRKFPGSLAAKLSQLRFDRPIAHFGANDDFSFIASARTLHDSAEIQFNVTILTSGGIPVGNSCGLDRFSLRQGESHQIKIVLPSPRLAPGRYHCCVSIGQRDSAGGWKEFDAVTDTLHFEVVAPNSVHGGAAPWKRTWGHISFPNLHAKLAGRCVAAQVGSRLS